MLGRWSVNRGEERNRVAFRIRNLVYRTGQLRSPIHPREIEILQFQRRSQIPTLQNSLGMEEQIDEGSALVYGIKSTKGALIGSTESSTIRV